MMHTYGLNSALIQIEEPMKPARVSSLCRTFSYKNLFNFHFPRTFSTQISVNRYRNDHKIIHGNLTRLKSTSLSTAAAYHVFDEIPVQENDALVNGFDFLKLMEEGGVRANYQTFVWLLDSCLKSGSLVDVYKLHGRILKMGFDSEQLLCDRILDACIASDDIDGTVKIFDDMPHRNVFTWNKLISFFAAKKLFNRVMSLIHRMLVENVNPNEATFASILRACIGGTIGFEFVKQIHARIIYHGFGYSPLVGNPLIDLYAKNGFIDCAASIFSKLSMKDNVSWVAMVSGLSQNGHEEKAILLFCQMHVSMVFPTPYVLSSVLSACAKIESYEIGKQIHGLVFKMGFSSETYVCNALVTLYSRSGNLVLSEQVFSQMQCKDGVSYNSLISGLALQGFSDRALALFEKMQFHCLKPDCVTLASLLHACSSMGALLKGKQLHSYIIKAGMSSDNVIEGALLDLYVKGFDIETARDFFLTTETDNIVLWNVMLVAYGQLDNLSESFKIFKGMQIEGLIPNQFTYPSILRTCTSLGALDLGEQIHCQAVKTGFQNNEYVCSVLIDMYAKLGLLDTARTILRKLQRDDIVSWTAMISGYTMHNLYAEALKLFEEMLGLGIRPDNIGYSCAIGACAGMQLLNQGKQIHAQSYVAGYSDDLSIGNAIVNLYARCGKVEEAHLAFGVIDSKDNISWNGLISGLAQSENYEEALQVFVKMNKAGLQANIFAFGSAVSASANLANIKQGAPIHAMITKTGFDSETEVANSLITLYSKCGILDDAKKKFSEIPVKNEVSWNSIITGYSQHGFGNEAVNHFEEMKRMGLKPNHVTFIGVLSACSHVGLVNEGLGYFESMRKEHGLVPKPEHYVCIVDLLGRAGLLKRARKFIEEMPIEPDAMAWRTLLSSCTIHKNMEIGEVAASHLLELEPRDSATHVLVSNMYAVSGKWDYRDRARQTMKDNGVKKEPGRSWIEVKNEIHAFFVGDRLHPLSDKVYEFLEHLNTRATEIGYVQDRYSLLTDIEQDHKEPTMCIHSEKLAISFGLLSLSDAVRIV